MHNTPVKSRIFAGRIAVTVARQCIRAINTAAHPTVVLATHNCASRCIIHAAATACVERVGRGNTPEVAQGHER